MIGRTAAEVIALLGLERHPEGGWYVQSFADKAAPGGRAHSTAIYFLLEGGQRSHWHRVDAAEVWHWYAGASLTLEIADDTGAWALTLGGDLFAGERPQAVVPPGAWQAASSSGDWTLVGCTVAPGFEFARFELAAPGWSPTER
jgi:predicted cupin superfamily sugar epimerase